MKKLWASALAMTVTLGLSLGCSHKPSKSDCETAWQHNIDIATKGNGAAADLGKGLYEALQPTFMEQCLAQADRSYVTCVNGANTTGEIQECRKKLDNSKKAAAKGSGEQSSN